MINLLADVMVIFLAVIIGQGTALLFGVPVTVFVDGEEVFSGNSSCIKLGKGGAVTSTKLDISNGFMCLMPSAQYVSTDVQVKRKQKDKKE